MQSRKVRSLLDEELGNFAEFDVATFNKVFHRQTLEFREVLLERFTYQFGRQVVIGVGAAFRFGHDGVNTVEFPEVGSSDPQGLSCKLLLGSVTPHNGSTTFRRD